MRLNRVVEERLVNLYRQGKVVGGLYRSLGQEATSVGTAYALEEGRHRRPPDPQPRRRPRHGLLAPGRDDAVHGARNLALGRQGLQPPLRPARAGRHLPHLDARRPGAGDGRDRSGRPHAEEGPRHDDLDRRRRHLDRRLSRGDQLRRRAEAARSSSSPRTTAGPTRRPSGNRRPRPTLADKAVGLRHSGRDQWTATTCSPSTTRRAARSTGRAPAAARRSSSA